MLSWLIAPPQKNQIYFFHKIHNFATKFKLKLKIEYTTLKNHTYYLSFINLQHPDELIFQHAEKISIFSFQYHQKCDVHLVTILNRPIQDETE